MNRAKQVSSVIIIDKKNLVESAENPAQQPGAQGGDTRTCDICGAPLLTDGLVKLHMKREADGASNACLQYINYNYT